MRPSRKSIEVNSLKENGRNLLYAIDSHSTVFLKQFSCSPELIDTLAHSAAHARIVLVDTSRDRINLICQRLEETHWKLISGSRWGSLMVSKLGVQLKLIDSDALCLQISKGEIWKDGLYVVCNSQAGSLSMDVLVTMLAAKQRECGLKVLLPESVHCDVTLAHDVFKDDFIHLTIEGLNTAFVQKYFLSKASSSLYRDEVVSCIRHQRAYETSRKALIFVPTLTEIDFMIEEISKGEVRPPSVYVIESEQDAGKLGQVLDQVQEEKNFYILFVLDKHEVIQTMILNLRLSGLAFELFDFAIDCGVHSIDTYSIETQREKTVTVSSSRTSIFHKVLFFSEIQARSNYFLLLTEESFKNDLNPLLPERHHKCLHTSLLLLQKFYGRDEAFYASAFVKTASTARVAGSLAYLKSSRTCSASSVLWTGFPCIPIADENWLYMVESLDFALQEFSHAIFVCLAKIASLIYAFDQHPVSSEYGILCQRLNDRDMGNLRAKESDFLTILNLWMEWNNKSFRRGNFNRGSVVKNGMEISETYFKNIVRTYPSHTDSNTPDELSNDVFKCLTFGFFANRAVITSTLPLYDEWIIKFKPSDADGTEAYLPIAIREPKKDAMLLKEGNICIFFRLDSNQETLFLGINQLGDDLITSAKAARFSFLRDEVVLGRM